MLRIARTKVKVAVETRTIIYFHTRFIIFNWSFKTDVIQLKCEKTIHVDVYQQYAASHQWRFNDYLLLFQVEDVNDQAPHFESARYYVSVAENMQAGSNIIKGGNTITTHS